MDVLDPTPSGILYDDERDSKPWGKYIAIALIVIAGIAARALDPRVGDGTSGS